jgi:2,3-dihydroxybiphenyl 1,2-dioxygenase
LLASITWITLPEDLASVHQSTRYETKQEGIMASVTQLGYLGFSVKDINAWEQFATNTLGLQISGREADGSLLLRMDEYIHRFLVHPTGKDDLDYVGWEVSDEHALREVAKQLKAAGIEVRKGTPEEIATRRVVDLLVYQDPNGIPSEIFYGPLMAFQTPFQSPRSLAGFHTGLLGLGHMAVTVNDLEQSVQFYRDVLGMRISDYIQIERPPGTKRRAAFFHCNPRHHSLTIVAMPQAPKRLLHFMLQLKALDDVGATYYLCQDQGTPIARGLGRHTNDHMVSFYLTTPSGFEAEWGWGGREVDDSTWQVQQHVTGSMWGHRPVSR